MRREQDSPRAWAVVAAALLATTVLLGISYSFGVLVDPVAAGFDGGRGGAALAFALTIALPFLLAPVTGRLSDRYGPRPPLAAAALLAAAGLVLCAHAPSAWTFHLSYGLGVGGGAACAFVPMVATVGGWFERRRPLALAIALAGTGIGTLVAAPLVALLVESHGVRTTCLVLAAVVLATIPLAAVLAAPAPARPAADPRPSDGGGFARLYVAGVAGSLSAFIGFAFVVPFALDHGVTSTDASWLLAAMGAANVAGRLLLPLVASRIGLLASYRATLAALAGSGLVWAAAGGFLPALAGFALLFGAAYGGFVTLSPTVAAKLLGTAALGRRLGALYTSAGIGALTGPPLAGATLDATGGFEAAIALAVTAGSVGALALRSPTGNRRRATLTTGWRVIASGHTGVRATLADRRCP